MILQCLRRHRGAMGHLQHVEFILFRRIAPVALRLLSGTLAHGRCSRCGSGGCLGYVTACPVVASAVLFAFPCIEWHPPPEHTPLGLVP